MMKTKLLLVLLVAIGLMAGTAQANLLVNPSFEDGVFDPTFSPDHWENYYTTYGQVHYWVSSAAEAHSGSKYMKMHNWLVRGPSYVTSAWLGQEVLGVKKGKDYTFTVWAKNGVENQTNLANIFIDWLDSAGVGHPNPDAVAVGTDSVDIVVTDADWIEIDFGAFTAPEGAVAAYVFLGNLLDNGLNAIYYDDVSMLGPDPNVHAGPDMVSWDGETISLTGSENFPGDPVTITWSANPDYCAVITDGDTLTPTVQVNPVIESGPATIANHSFENGLDNWDIISGDGHGTWNGYAYDTDAGEGTVYITPTDGRMCAYLDGVTGEEAGVLSQVLANTLAADTTYTLTVDVVNDWYYEEDVQYKVQLLAGENVLAEDDDGHSLNQHGDWETSTVSFATGSTHTYLGKPLEIRLVAIYNDNGTPEDDTDDTTNRMNFDNVHLTADPPFPAYVPDILPLTLTLEIDGNKYDTMKIDAYPDGCAAKMGAGLRETTDIVGDDCITNLPDFTEMAKTWLDHNAFTEPITKPVENTSGGGVAIGLIPDEANPTASAREVILEQFDYTAGSALTGAGGTGFSGAWSTTSSGTDPLFTVRAGGLSFYPLRTAGNSVYRTGIDGRAEANRVISAESQATLLADDSTIWFSVLYQNTGTSWGTTAFLIGTDTYDVAAGGGLVNFTVGGEGFGIGASVGTYGSIIRALAYDDIAGLTYVNSTVTAPTAKLIVGRIVWAASGSSDTLTLYNVTDLTTAPSTPIATVTADLDQSAFDLVVLQHNNNTVIFDEIRFGLTYRTVVPATVSAPTPAHGAYVHPASDLELSWTNGDGDPVWVDVWFGTGTEPNELDPNSVWIYDMTKVVDAVEDANSATVDASTEGTYCWQVNSYIYGDPNVVDYDIYGTDANLLPVDEGPVWEFYVVTDIPVSVNAGNNMIAWSGQAVQLASSVDDDGVSDLTIGWSADPNTGVVFEPNEFVEDPTVTITKDFSIITIANHSFEDPVLADGTAGRLTGWATPSSGARVWNPGDGTGAYNGHEGIAPDGENVLWINGIGACSQVLADTLTANTNYTLTVEVAVNQYYENNPSYKVELLAGETVLAEDDNSIPLMGDTFWETSTVTFDSTGVDPALLGEPLQIRLGCNIILDMNLDQGETNFDDVHLTVTPDRPFSGAVETVVLTLSAHDAVSSDEDTLNIEVYDTACLAAIGEGHEYDPGDFDKDCDTDLKDFATLVAEWLVNNELTESIVKP